jgi:hypothetical protein
MPSGAKAKLRPSTNFAAVPLCEAGEPLSVARTQTESETYIYWLADYLHRPQSGNRPMGRVLRRRLQVPDHPELNARSPHIIDEREVEIQGDDLSVGSDVLSRPGRH